MLCLPWWLVVCVGVPALALLGILASVLWRLGGEWLADRAP